MNTVIMYVLFIRSTSDKEIMYLLQDLSCFPECYFCDMTVTMIWLNQLQVRWGKIYF